MIESPVAVLLVAAAAISGLIALKRRRSRKDTGAKRTEQLIKKLEAAARETDEHIAAHVHGGCTRGGRHG